MWEIIFIFYKICTVYGNCAFWGQHLHWLSCQNDGMSRAAPSRFHPSRRSCIMSYFTSSSFFFFWSIRNSDSGHCNIATLPQDECKKKSIIHLKSWSLPSSSPSLTFTHTLLLRTWTRKRCVLESDAGIIKEPGEKDQSFYSSTQREATVGGNQSSAGSTGAQHGEGHQAWRKRINQHASLTQVPLRFKFEFKIYKAAHLNTAQH